MAELLVSQVFSEGFEIGLEGGDEYPNVEVRVLLETQSKVVCFG